MDSWQFFGILEETGTGITGLAEPKNQFLAILEFLKNWQELVLGNSWEFLDSQESILGNS